MPHQRIKPLHIKEVIAELKAAATAYRSTRKRAAIHDFLEAVYAHLLDHKEISKDKNLQIEAEIESQIVSRGESSPEPHNLKSGFSRL